MSNIRRVVTIVIFVTFLISVILLMVLIAFSYLVFFHFQVVRKCGMKGQEEPYLYKYLKIDSILNNTRRGIIATPEKIITSTSGEEEFVSFEHSVGVHTIITNFGSDEYYCTGSCYCLEHRRLTGTGFPVVGGLLYLVSAVTSAIAIKRAEEYFSQKCEKGLDEECPSESILSVVDDCKPINLVGASSSTTEKKEINEKKKEPDKTDFMCTGRCVEDNFARYEIACQEFDEEFHPMVDIDNQLQFEFFQALAYEKTEVSKFCNNLELTTKLTVTRLGSYDAQEEMAINHFRSIHLQKYCKSNSIFTLDEIGDRFFDRDTSSKVKKVWMRFHEIYMNKICPEGTALCRAKREFMVRNWSVDDERSLQFVTIVCLRQFTKEEWDEGIPYESHNLRHWKEGHMMNPDKYKKEYM